MFIDNMGSMCIKTSCLWICENIAAYPHDHANYIGYNYWVPVVTPGGPGNDPDRAVFTTTGSVNLSPVANPPTLPDYEAAAVVNHFTGRSSNYQDAWLGILVALPNWYPFYSPGTQTFQVESSAPFVWLDGVQKGGDNHYGGWSIWNQDTKPSRSSPRTISRTPPSPPTSRSSAHPPGTGADRAIRPRRTPRPWRGPGSAAPGGAGLARRPAAAR